MQLVFADLETFSDIPIKYGSNKYAEGAEILLFGYAIGEGPARVWDLTSYPYPPEDLRNAIEHHDTRIVFHNGMQFDSVVLRRCLPQFDWSPNRIIDTMVIAYQHGLPGALGDLCKVFKLSEDEAKDRRGTRLVQLFCQPCPSSWKVRRATRHTHPDDWADFVEYCRRDIISMRHIFYKLPKFNLSQAERAAQLADATINMRGIKMDLELARGALELDAEHKARLAKETKARTGGAVDAATQRDRMMAFIEREYGWKLDSMTKAEVERKIEADDVPEPVKDLLRLRIASAATSATKYQRVLEATNTDGRLRGTLQFRGAMRTGRFAGRIFQPQNLARPALKEAGFFEAIDLIKSGFAAAFYDDVRPVLSTCLRGLVIADEGKTFTVADYSNVEGRVLAWLAGEAWKIQAFKDFDAGKGHDLYKLTYGRTFGIKPEDVTKPQRQMGKVLELAMGYGGGAGAFVTFANGYGMDLDKVADDIYAALDPVIVEQAESSWDWFVEQKATHGLSHHTFVAVDAVKRAWRLANPAIVKFWKDVGDAVLYAINSQGAVRDAGRYVKAMCDGTFLRVVLPSGRALCYANPRVSEEKQGSFSYLGVDQKTRKWGRLESYGPKMCISKGTLVVTDCGLVPIENVTADMKVFDGTAFVSQGGAVYKGERNTIKAFGVWMTPDHLVRTVEGWKDASSCEGLNRAYCRIPSCAELRGLGWTPFDLERLVQRLRKNDSDACGILPTASEEWQSILVRMHEESHAQHEAFNARHEQASGLGGVARNATALHRAEASCMEEIRSPWNHCLRKVVELVRELLGGHGADVQNGARFGSDRQQQGLQSGELSLGHSQRELQQSKEHRFHRWEAPFVLGGNNRDRKDDASVSSTAQLPDGAPVRQAQRNQSVYDLINCGPFHQFVVLDENGAPLIVHNCENVVQATSCDILCASLVTLEAEGFCPVMHVHDEIVCEVPKDEGEKRYERMCQIMTNPGRVYEGLPLAVDGFVGDRYKKKD